MTLPDIDPEFKSLLPILSTKDYASLEAAIVAEGCLEPITVWKEEDILIDGHHRLWICQIHNLPFKRNELSFPNRNAVKQWIIDHQLARRNLTKEQRAYYMGLDYLNKKKAVGNPKLAEKPSISQFPQNEGIGVPATPLPTSETASEVAAKHGASRATVERNAEFAEAVDAHAAVDPSAREEILSGKSKKTKPEVIATAPTVCDRCRRVGIVKACTECARLRELKETRPAPERKPRAEKPPKNGREKFPWKEWPKHYGTVVRLLEQLQQSYPAERNGPDAKRLFQLINDYGTLWEQVKDRLVNPKK